MKTNEENVNRTIAEWEQNPDNKAWKESRERLILCKDCGGNEFMISVADEDNPGDIKYIICQNCRQTFVIPTISINAFVSHMDASVKVWRVMRRTARFNLFLALAFFGLFIWKLNLFNF